MSFSQRGRSLKENLTIIAAFVFFGEFCPTIREKKTKRRGKKKEDEIRAPVEKNVSVFNNLRSCPRGKYLETARSFGNGPSIFLACE